MSRLAAFARFWWDFVVGDDLPLALGVLASIVVAVLLVDAGVDAWWLLPPAVMGMLAASVARVTHSKTARRQP
jgi:hypothetical protein